MLPVWRLGAVALLLCPIAASAAAPAQPNPRPESFRKLMDCRQILGDADRLACFDAQASAVEAAEAREDLVVIDRAQVRQARRSLFGLTLPDFNLFDREKDVGKQELEEFTKIETTIKAANQNGAGRWVLVTAEGARWVQSENRELSRDPRPGQKIVIRRAALGSFLANIDGQIAIRVSRVN